MKCLNCLRTDIRARGLCGACYQRYTYRQKAYGKFKPTYIDAAPVKDHIRALREARMGYISIAKQAGIERRTVAMMKDHIRCHRQVAEAILSIPLPASHDLHADGARVPAIGTVRRLRALAVTGWSAEDLAPHCGIHAEILRRVRGGRQKYVNAKTARAIDKMFSKLQLTYGPCKNPWRAKHAKQKGWAPPLAWDEDSIDDPNANPINPADKKDAWFEDYLELKELGKTKDHIAERLGISPDALDIKLRRRNASTHSSKEHEQVRQGDEQMVCADRQAVAAV